jgi:hypothetical protein
VVRDSAPSGGSSWWLQAGASLSRFGTLLPSQSTNLGFANPGLDGLLYVVCHQQSRDLMRTLSNLQLVSEFNFCGHRAKGLVSVLLPLIREFQCVSYGNVYLHALHTYRHCIAAISSPLWTRMWPDPDTQPRPWGSHSSQLHRLLTTKCQSKHPEREINRASIWGRFAHTHALTSDIRVPPS